MLVINTLPESLSSYYLDHYDDLFALHPAEKSQVIVRDTEVAAHRYYKSYLYYPEYDASGFKSFMFSDKTFEKNPVLPEILTPLFTFINKDEAEPFNQVTVNWFENGMDYIPYHRDCLQNINGDTVIVSFGETRTLSFKKDDTRMNIDCPHGTVVRMDLANQNEYTHSVLKNVSKLQSRISVSFRNYTL